MTAQIPPEEEALLGPPPPLKHAASSPGLPRHGTWLSSSLILFNSILGSGVLAIPWAMSQVEGSWTPLQPASSLARLSCLHVWLGGRWDRPAGRLGSSSSPLQPHSRSWGPLCW